MDITVLSVVAFGLQLAIVSFGFCVLRSRVERLETKIRKGCSHCNPDMGGDPTTVLI